MARTVRDAKLDSRAARDRLKPSAKPYFKAIDEGLHVGYRKGKTAGKWVMRRYVGGQSYVVETIGTADDTLDADGSAILTFAQAQAIARDRFLAPVQQSAEREAAAPPAAYTVADGIRDYLADYAARGGKAVAGTRIAATAHILPAMGEVAVESLTRDRIRGWHRALATAPARVRVAKGAEPKHRDIGADPDAARRRRSTANRVLTVLKAALNHARAEGKVTCPDDAWKAAKPFREADAAKIRYLLEDEATRLVNACPPDFRALVTAALLTGARYGELAAMRATDFDPQSGTVTIGRSKGGKPRHVALTDEGRTFFAQMSAGRPGSALLFQRDRLAKPATRTEAAVWHRGPWQKSDQFRLMRDACTAARITPAVSFHELRHSYASRLAQRGVPMGVIAAQLGHSDTRMTEKHYAHLAPNYVAETVRNAFGSMGILTSTNVTPIRA